MGDCLGAFAQQATAHLAPARAGPKCFSDHFHHFLVCTINRATLRETLLTGTAKPGLHLACTLVKVCDQPSFGL